MILVKCTFCGIDIAQGIGKLYATKEGTVYYFCSSKCERNKLKLKRKQQKVRWTNRYKEEKQIRLHGKEAKVVKKKEKKEDVKKKGTKKDRRAERKVEKKKKTVAKKTAAKKKAAEPKPAAEEKKEE